MGDEDVTIEVGTGDDETVDDEMPILDEAVQKAFDLKAITDTAAQIRSLMANAKVNRALAQIGLLKGEKQAHPNQFKEAIANHRKALDMLRDLASRVGDTGLPEVTLDVPEIEVPGPKPGDVVSLDGLTDRAARK